MNFSPDVFVVGGGPAGLATAIAARQQGFSVTVADGGEPPLDKACGEGLLPETQVALEKLNIQIPKEMGFRFRGIRFLEGDAQLCAEFPEGNAIGIRRTVLHELLIARAEECGVNLLWKTSVSNFEAGSVMLGGRQISARWIIGADGRGSRVRRWSGLDKAGFNRAWFKKEEHEGNTGQTRFASRRHYRVKPWTEYLEIYWGRLAQAYVTPVSAEEICVVVLAGKPEGAKFAETWVDWPMLKERLANAEITSRERGAATSMHSLLQVCNRNVALVGDASGSVDAITGEGLRLAFQQGLALAAAMRCGDLRAYQKVHRRLMRRPTVMGKLMLYMGRNATIRKRAFKSFGGRPELFAEFLAMHVGDYTPKQALGAGARFSWKFLAA
jgi:flavin-dependent dehydrogenase